MANRMTDAVGPSTWRPRNITDTEDAHRRVLAVLTYLRAA